MKDRIEIPARERDWYRSSVTGDRGYKVVWQGVECIRLDRPGEHMRKLGPEWITDSDVRPIRAVDLAQVVLAADRATCAAIGMHQARPKEWLSMTDRDRALWIEMGPPTTDPVRLAVYEAIKSALQPFM